MQRMLKRCWGFATVCILLATAVGAQEKADELRLRNGTTLSGHFVEGDKDNVVFRTPDGLKIFKRSEVQRIVLAGEREEGTPPNDANDPWGRPPVNYTAKAPHKIARVIALHRITANKNADAGKFEPEVVKISGDGSKIAFWAPNSGLYTINPDGTERNLVWEKDNANHQIRGDTFEMSPDGKVIFWQVPPYGEVRRVNSDGTDEKMLVREGSEYTPLRLRQGGKRIYFGSRRGIFSVDTEGKGDLKEIITMRQMGQIHDTGDIMLDEFDVSEDGSRVVLAVWHPKAQKKQLCTIKGNGTEFRQIAKTDFEPIKVNITPDGGQITFWQPERGAYVVNWDGSDMRQMPIPLWDANGVGAQYLNRFTPDSKWFSYWGNEGGGQAQITRLDGSGRFESYNAGRWDDYENALFNVWSPHYSNDLRRFVFISLQHVGQVRPRQIVLGEINPRQIDDLPVLSDIEFLPAVSTNPQLPTHRSTLKARIKKGASDVERVQFMLTPLTQQGSAEPVRFEADRGWYGLKGDKQLRDDGKNGDAQAGDGVFSTDGFGPDPGDRKPVAGHYQLRIVAHDETNAVIVDVDGVDIK